MPKRYKGNGTDRRRRSKRKKQNDPVKPHKRNSLDIRTGKRKK